MLDGLKKRLERALDALEKKGPGPTEDDIDRLLAGMREELIDARARVKGLEDRVRDLDRKLERIPAASEAAKTLQAKRSDIVATLNETRAEAAELGERFKEAIGQRDALAIRSRTARASDNVREGAADTTRTFDRLAEKVEDAERLTSAERELDEELGGDSGRTADLPPPVAAAYRERHADQLLDELKRRMGVEGEEPADSGVNAEGAEPARGGESTGGGPTPQGEGSAEGGASSDTGEASGSGEPAQTGTGDEERPAGGD